MWPKPGSDTMQRVVLVCMKQCNSMIQTYIDACKNNNNENENMRKMVRYQVLMNLQSSKFLKNDPNPRIIIQRKTRLLVVSDANFSMVGKKSLLRNAGDWRMWTRVTWMRHMMLLNCSLHHE